MRKHADHVDTANAEVSLPVQTLIDRQCDPPH